MYKCFEELYHKENYNETMKILIKLPSRSRPDKLISIYKLYMDMAEYPEHINGLITLDRDDPTVTYSLKEKLMNINPNTTIIVGYSGTKIKAVNRDMEHAGSYDILLLASDDMIPIVKGYDTIIRDHMTKYYPDTDGVLWYNDGYQGSKLNTLCILGKAYYQRFNCIYHPSYKSEWCDNEFTDVANTLGKQTYFEDIIIRHEHPVTMSTVLNDELYIKNTQLALNDRDNYYERKSTNFN